MANPTKFNQQIRNLLKGGRDNDRELEHLVTQNQIDVNEREEVLFDLFVAPFWVCY